MNRNAAEKNIPDLISKEIMGIISDQEREILLLWIESSPDNRQLYEELSMSSLLSEGLDELTNTDTDKAYNYFKRKASGGRLSRKMVLGITAAAAVAAVVSVGILLNSNGIEEGARYADVYIPAGSVRAELILSDNTTVELNELDESIVVTQWASVNDNTLDYASNQEQATPAKIEYNTLRVPIGAEYPVILSDGTQVILNSGSELTFPVAFAGGERCVKLTGEAYFNVKSDEQRPFVIELLNIENSAIKVTGTTFNLRCYPDEDSMVATLVEGRIAYVAPGLESSLLPGQQLTVKDDGTMEKTFVDTDLACAWKEGMFAFERTPLVQLLSDMSRWYGIDVIWQSEASKTIPFTGRIPRSESFNQIIDILSMTGDNELIIEGKTVYVK